MDRKYLILALAMGMALVTGYRFASKTDRRPVPTISDFSKEVTQLGSTYKVIFRGSVVNPLDIDIYDVNVTVHWSEAGNVRHESTKFVGDVSGGGSVGFEVSYECEWMLLVQSASCTLEFS